MSVAFLLLAVYTLGVHSLNSRPGVPVRDDWTTVPQGDRILPRLDTQEPLDGAERKIITYGSHTVKASGRLSSAPGVKLMRGMSAISVESSAEQELPAFTKAESPCDDCFVTAIEYTAKYDNGTDIGPLDGIWLNHVVLMSAGEAHKAQQSSQDKAETGMFGSYTPLGPEIIWAGGNERPTLRLNTQYKYGIYWPEDLHVLFEIENDLQQDTNVTLAITYEYIQRSYAPGYRDAYLVWHTINGPPRNGQYVQRSQTFPEGGLPKSGVLLYAAGHMGDGGTGIILYNNGKAVCRSRMFYNNRPGYGNVRFTRRHARNFRRSENMGSPPGASHVDSEPTVQASGVDQQIAAPSNVKHISDPGHCTSFGRINEGDFMNIEAHYNTDFYPMRIRNGQPEQMAIVDVYIGPDLKDGEDPESIMPKPNPKLFTDPSPSSFLQQLPGFVPPVQLSPNSQPPPDPVPPAGTSPFQPLPPPEPVQAQSNPAPLAPPPAPSSQPWFAPQVFGESTGPTGAAGAAGVTGPSSVDQMSQLMPYIEQLRAQGRLPPWFDYLEDEEALEETLENYPQLGNYLTNVWAGGAKQQQPAQQQPPFQSGPSPGYPQQFPGQNGPQPGRGPPSAQPTPFQQPNYPQSYPGQFDQGLPTFPKGGGGGGPRGGPNQGAGGPGFGPSYPPNSPNFNPNSNPNANPYSPTGGYGGPKGPQGGFGNPQGPQGGYGGPQGQSGGPNGGGPSFSPYPYRGPETNGGGGNGPRPNGQGSYGQPYGPPYGGPASSRGGEDNEEGGGGGFLGNLPFGGGFLGGLLENSPFGWLFGGGNRRQ